MKKEYINPEMDIYEIKTCSQLMAGSPTLGIGDDVLDAGGAETPPFMPDLGPSIPTGPSFPFGL